MKVVALISFVSRIDGKKYQPDAGDELDMPKGADWLKAGLVRKKSTAKKAAAPESASVSAPESAVKSKAKPKKKKS